jgi:hypothetical protein
MVKPIETPIDIWHKEHVCYHKEGQKESGSLISSGFSATIC